MKPKGKVVEGEKVYLKYLTVDMVSQRYVDWLNNEEVNQYLEARFGCPHTIEGTREFVKSMWDDGKNHMFAIMLREGDKHVGNIKVGPINDKHKFAEVGIIIGEREVWGKGIGSEAVALASKYAFEKLGVHKLVAGCYGPNQGSLKAFLKAGYVLEGNVKGKFLFKGKYVDDLIFGKLKE